MKQTIVSEVLETLLKGEIPNQETEVQMKEWRQSLELCHHQATVFDDYLTTTLDLFLALAVEGCGFLVLSGYEEEFKSLYLALVLVRGDEKVVINNGVMLDDTDYDLGTATEPAPASTGLLGEVTVLVNKHLEGKDVEKKHYPDGGYDISIVIKSEPSYRHAVTVHRYP